MPAEPGWRVVRLSKQGRLTVGGTVIAWGIRTERSQALRTIASGITTSGNESNDERLFGYLRPDGKVEVTRGELYESLAEAQQSLPSQVPLRASTA